MTNDSSTGGYHYVYVLFRPDNGAPFYVGMGTGRRMWISAYDARRSSHKSNLIRKFKGTQIPAVKIATDLTERQALAIEETWIAALGKWPNGPLVNKADRGSSSARRGPMSAETRAKIAATKIGKPRSERTKEKLRAAAKRQMTPEAREYLRKKAAEQFNDPEMRQKVSAACKIAQNWEDRIEANRARGLARTKEQTDRFAEMGREYNSRPEVKAANSASLKIMWADPVWRAKILEAQAVGKANARK